MVQEGKAIFFPSSETAIPIRFNPKSMAAIRPMHTDYII
jgi:hypothetical protein